MIQKFDPLRGSTLATLNWPLQKYEDNMRMPFTVTNLLFLKATDRTHWNLYTQNTHEYQVNLGQLAPKYNSIQLNYFHQHMT
jgi:hypothetical protein